MRISQFIILPDYQRRGLASILHDSIFQKFMDKEECFEITIESPTSVMSKIYNTYVLKLLLKSSNLDKLLNSDKTQFVSVDKSNILKLLQRSIGEMELMAKAVKCELIKTSRIYEFLICILINNNDDDTFEIFSQYVKKR